MTQENICEIVTFRLVGGTDPAEFTKAAAGLAAFIERCGGMVSRNLSVDDTGLWTDHIIWPDMASAQRAAQGVSSAPEAAPVMAMIAPDDVMLRHAKITLQQP